MMKLSCVPVCWRWQWRLPLWASSTSVLWGLISSAAMADQEGAQKRQVTWATAKTMGTMMTVVVLMMCLKLVMSQNRDPDGRPSAPHHHGINHHPSASPSSSTLMYIETITITHQPSPTIIFITITIISTHRRIFSVHWLWHFELIICSR